MSKIITKNGKRIVVPDNATVADLRDENGDDLLRKTGSSFQRVDATEPIQEHDQFRSVPKVTKGGGLAAPSPWVQEDLRILQRELGGRVNVTAKPTERGGQPYLAVMIDNVRLNDRKFGGRTFGKLLFLLPKTYPATPPIGVYINYPYKLTAGVDDHHDPQGLGFRAYYGAPDLTEAGWYWYCLQPYQGATWRPQVNPEDGHNLTALYAAASHAVNS